MQALVRFPMNAVAGVRRAPRTRAVHVRRASVAMVEPQRTFAANPPSSPLSLSSMGVATAEDAAAATSARCEGTMAGAADSSPSHNPPAQTAKGFRSSTQFRMSPAQVNEQNVPSAREVVQMIPTLQELRAQLPDALELERMYIPHQSALGANGVAGRSETSGERADATTASSAPSSLSQKMMGPLEALFFGSANDEIAAATEATPTTASPQRPPSREHVLLAYRALFWGTAFALLGFSATVSTAMYLCGYHSLRDLQQGVRDKMRHDEERLYAMAAPAATGEGAAVDTVMKHYVVDVTHPTEAWRQLQEIWSALQRLGEEEETANTTVAAAQ
ncbi:hypothetical protein conserved [Leishmania donovani]|uniref:Uncharacterized protein n=3 Tax=Leishmania donovani species complex TaxID=38574 RepID=A4I1Y0_LEIIN|nr:conserved hypothetical protein [Leishmania infantum JPCM5]XP_003861632.1 hypothetical protein, conserved [Leishmania donovani]CAC9495973.1 hypothetical_protein_-_conserved [Leishmania infantum]AYU79643.1 hypothetical protein LdCL_260009800 [Leishmania donovani]CAJ1989631.1 hypothetical protein conserved [Leishmania donovani]CAM68763.1 conserved hypothetical protein [Leishmania infantum JPCM5]CBZ34932.1 hypothetical protein, conserved [Leishmania donovani]|eukprot:XP_001470391.1 conserved hypothetical protein [Leishmania infantum JPCM5]